MAFQRARVRLERFNVEAHYHAAFNFFSLKGALAERWAHGPVFGAYAEQAQQVTLTPAEPTKDKRLMQGVYGIRASAFNYEGVTDEQEAYDLASSWLADVFAVLKPKQTTRLISQWFALYPLGDARSAQAASKRLRDRYYQLESITALTPEGFDAYHYAVDGIFLRGDDNVSVIAGAVGPPHRGTFFNQENAERDRRWWMGVRVNYVRDNQDGIDHPEDALDEVLESGSRYYDDLVRRALTGIV